MTYKFYKRFQIVFLILWIPLLSCGTFRYELVKVLNYPIFWLILGLAYPILSIMFLYFGIYAHLCGIKTVRKIDGPITLIVLGSVFTLFSFAPPIVSYFLTPYEILEPYTSAELQTLPESAIDLSKTAGERLFSARRYYIYTGKTIEYFSENGKKELFSPNKSVEEWRNNHIRYLQKAKKMASVDRSIFISHIIIALVSAVVFLVFLWHKSLIFKKKK